MGAFRAHSIRVAGSRPSPHHKQPPFSDYLLVLEEPAPLDFLLFFGFGVVLALLVLFLLFFGVVAAAEEPAPAAPCADAVGAVISMEAPNAKVHTNKSSFFIMPSLCISYPTDWHFN